MWIARRQSFAWVILGMGLAVGRADAAPDVIVAPHGNDAWSGTLAEPAADGRDGPVATLQRAKELVAELRRREPSREGAVVVALRGGTYVLSAAVVFGPDDSGSEQSPTVYQAYGDERPILSGGVRLGGWQVTAKGHWQTTIEDVKAGRWSFAQLFVNDQRRERPRLPRQGYYRIAEQLPPTPEAGNQGCNQFRYRGDDLRADWSHREDVEVLAFHQWSASRMRIAALMPEEHRVVFTGTTRSTSTWGAFAEGHRFLAINVREALSEPGEWYLDRPSGVLTYVPRAGESPESTVVIAPRSEQLLVLQGDAASKRWVHHLEFQGLDFAHTNWTLPPGGQSFPQAEIGLSSAIATVGARQIRFDRCAVRHTGGYAMAFGAGSRHHVVERCELFDLGGGGIKIGHAGRGTWDEVLRLTDDTDMQVSHHVVRDCRIAHGGRLHSAAVGVWIGQSSYNLIEHNDVFDFYYTGFSVGWTWGYGRSDAHHNEIAFNHVHAIGQGVLSDLAAIYTLGIQPGTVVHDNKFHDIQSYDYGGWGLYTDEGSSEIVLENNLVYRTKTGGFHQHYGKQNTVRNNILALATEHQLQRTRTEPHVSFTFERNIVYWDNASPLFGSNWNDNHFQLDHNLYWNATGQPITLPGNLNWEQWRTERGQDQHSLVADPRFVDPAAGDFRLLPDSPAIGLGFKPFDASQAGCRVPAVLTRDLPAVPKTFE